MKIQNFQFLLLVIAFLCDSSFSNATENTDYKKNVRYKLKQVDDSGQVTETPTGRTSKQTRSRGFPKLNESNQPSQSNFVQTSWSTSSLGGNSSLSSQLNDLSFQNSQVSWSGPINNASKSLINIVPLQTGCSQNCTIQKAIQKFILDNKINGSSQGSWVVWTNSSNNPMGQISMQTEFEQNYSTIQKVIQNFISGNKSNELLQGTWAVLMNSSNIPIKKIPIDDGFNQTYTIRKAMQKFNLDNEGNGANSQTLQGSWIVLVNSSNLSLVKIKLQTGYMVNYTMQVINSPIIEVVNIATIRVSVPVSTLTTQITTVIQKTLVPYLQKYLSPIKSEVTGTRTEILIVLLPKLQQLITDLSNLKTQLSISSTSNSQQVLTVFLSQLTIVITELQSSVNDLQIAAQKADNVSKQLPETLLKPLSNIQKNLNRLQPVLQVIKPSQGPTSQVVDGKENLGPTHPNLNVEDNGSTPAPHEVPSTTKGGSGPLNPNLNVDGSRKSSSTPKTNPVEELSRLVDHIPVIASRSGSLNDAVITAKNLEAQLSDIHNLTLNGSGGKSKDHEKDIQRAILRVTHSMAILQKGPLQTSSDLPKYSNVSVLTFSIHSTQIVLSLITVFKFYFGDNIPTIEFDGQTLNTATVELLSNTATNLQLLLPYARDLSGKNDGKILVPYQDDVDHSINNVFKSLKVLMPYLKTVTSELSSGTPQSNQPKDLLLTVTNLIVNFELTYPFYANILGNRAKQLPQLDKKNRDLYIVALSISAQLHNVSLASTEFHQTVWTKIVPQFTKFVSVIVSFDLTLLKDSPGSTDLSANLQLLLPYVQKISETKSSPAGVALQATFALIRPQLEQLSQTINAKAMRSRFSSNTFTKESIGFLTQFYNMFKSLNLLLTYLEVNNSTKSASADFVLYTIADFKVWLSQLQQVVSNALKNVSGPSLPNPNVERNSKINSTSVANVIKELNRLSGHLLVTKSVENEVSTAQNLNLQLSSLRNLTLAENVSGVKDQAKDIQRAIVKVTHGMVNLEDSLLGHSSSTFLQFLIHSTQIISSLVNLFDFYFGVNFPTIKFEGQSLNTATVELLAHTYMNIRYLLAYTRDYVVEHRIKISVSDEADLDHAINSVISTLTALLPYIRNVTADLISGPPHPDKHKHLLDIVEDITSFFETMYPVYGNYLLNRAKQLPQLLKTNQDLYIAALPLLSEYHNLSLAGTNLHQTVWTNIVPQFEKFVNVIIPFNSTLLMGPPGPSDLSANLQMLLPYARETKSKPGFVRKAIFALLRPQLHRLSQTLTAKAIRDSYTVTFTKESIAFLTQFSNMFENLQLLLKYIDNTYSKQSEGEEQRLSLQFTVPDFQFWLSKTHQVVLDALIHTSRSTNVTKTLDELNRLVDHIPRIESLNEAVTTAEKVNFHLTYLRNLTRTGNEIKPKDQDKNIQRVIQKVALKIDTLKTARLQEFSDLPKYSNVSVLTFSVHSTQIVLSLVNYFKFYFGVNFSTIEIDGQALNTAAVELLSSVGTNLQLLLPYARDLSGKNNSKILVSYQDDVDHAINNVFSSVTVLTPYLVTVTSELTSGAPHADQPKNLLLTVTNLIVNFELTYPFCANILRNRARKSPQKLEANRNLYIVALSFLAHLHNVSLTATDFHQTIWTKIVPKFSNFAHNITTFDFTLTKGPPANLKQLLPDVRTISETKSSSAEVALGAIFALIRPQLEQLSQTLSSKTMRDRFTITFAQESIVMLTQFSNTFKSLDLLLTYLDVSSSKKSASADFFLFTIADFKLWFSQAHQVVLGALENVEANRRSISSPLSDAVDELNRLINHVPEIASLKDAIVTAQNLHHQLSYLEGLTQKNQNEQRRLKLGDHSKDIKIAVLKMTLRLPILRKSALQASSDFPTYSNVSVITFVTYSTKVELSLVNLCVFFFGLHLSKITFEDQLLNHASFELLSNIGTNFQLLLPYARDLSQKNNTEVWVPPQTEFDNAINTLIKSLVIQGSYLRLVAHLLLNVKKHRDLSKDLLLVHKVISNFETIFPYYYMILRNNRKLQPEQQLSDNFEQYLMAESMLYELHTTEAAGTGFGFMLEELVQQFFVKVMYSAVFDLKELNGPPGPIDRSAIIQSFVSTARNITKTNPSSAPLALNSYFCLLRPYFFTLSRAISAKKMRENFSHIKFTHKDSIKSLTEYSNMFKSLDLLLTTLDSYNSTVTVFVEFFPFSQADYKLWFSKAHQVVLDTIKKVSVELGKVSQPTRKPKRNGWVSLRHLPDLKTNSAEKAPFKWGSDFFFDDEV